MGNWGYNSYKWSCGPLLITGDGAHLVFTVKGGTTEFFQHRPALDHKNHETLNMLSPKSLGKNNESPTKSS